MLNNTSRPPKKRKKFDFHAIDFILPLGVKTKLMGIINITPDSFSEDGILARKSAQDFTSVAVHQGRKFITQGADILDVGGESSRPGSSRITAEEEIRRIIPAVKALSKLNLVPVSVDTYKTRVAQEALDAGASIINNIKGIQLDKGLLKMIRNYKAGVILMHMKGQPNNMQRNIKYNDLIQDIILSLQNSIEICLEIGIKSNRIIIDPGIGFGKTTNHNLEVINRLHEFKVLDQPLLIGPSRKSFIGNILNRDAKHRIWGTAAAVSAGIIRGAHMVRVHDLKEMREVALISDAIINQADIPDC